MFIFEKIKTVVAGIIGFFILVLGGYAYVQKKKVENRDEEIDDLKEESVKTKADHEVETFEKINKEKKGQADEKISEINEKSDDYLKPNTTYRV